MSFTPGSLAIPNFGPDRLSLKPETAHHVPIYYGVALWPTPGAPELARARSSMNGVYEIEPDADISDNWFFVIRVDDGTVPGKPSIARGRLVRDDWPIGSAIGTVAYRVIELLRCNPLPDSLDEARFYWVLVSGPAGLQFVLNCALIGGP